MDEALKLSMEQGTDSKCISAGCSRDACVEHSRLTDGRIPRRRVVAARWKQGGVRNVGGIIIVREINY